MAACILLALIVMVFCAHFKHNFSSSDAHLAAAWCATHPCCVCTATDHEWQRMVCSWKVHWTVFYRPRWALVLWLLYLWTTWISTLGLQARGVQISVALPSIFRWVPNILRTSLVGLQDHRTSGGPPQRSGFVNRHDMIVCVYRKGRPWFVFIELSVVALSGGIGGWH